MKAMEDPCSGLPATHTFSKWQREDLCSSPSPYLLITARAARRRGLRLLLRLLRSSLAGRGRLAGLLLAGLRRLPVRRRLHVKACGTGVCVHSAAALPSPGDASVGCCRGSCTSCTRYSGLPSTPTPQTTNL